MHGLVEMLGGGIPVLSPRELMLDKVVLMKPI